MMDSFMTEYCRQGMERRLRQENAALRAENQRLQKDNAQLREVCKMTLSNLRRWRDEKPIRWDAAIDTNMMIIWDSLKAAIAAAGGETVEALDENAACDSNGDSDDLDDLTSWQLVDY